MGEGQPARFHDPRVVTLDQPAVVLAELVVFELGQDVVALPALQLAQMLFDFPGQHSSVGSWIGQDGLPGQIAFQVVGHFIRRAVTLLRILLQRLQADILQFARNGFVEPSGQHRVTLPDLRHLLAQVLTGKRQRSREHLVKNRPQRKDIAGGIECDAAHVLRREVVGRPHDLTGDR